MTDRLPGLAEALHRLLEADAPAADPLWTARIGALAHRLGAIVDRDADGSLFALVASASYGVEAYSSRHALATACVASLAASAAGYTAAERMSLACAALTMNVAMTALQDELVHRERTPTLAQRQAIDEHAARGAALLRAAGVGDETWLEIVARHHDAPAAQDDPEPADAPLARRLARVLQKADVFLAKLSPRAARKGLPVGVALRESCLDASGRTDAAGRALVHALGLYPPASIVRLANGETAVVIGRGARIDQPRVASVTGADRRPLPAPRVREAGAAEYRVQAALRGRELGVALGERRLEQLLREVQSTCLEAP
jgi:HD-GYP domain-containing protein (c-di-GMP phosphodiesterase class II)